MPNTDHDHPASREPTRDERLAETERESFPASDPPSWTTTGSPDHARGMPGSSLPDFRLPASTGQTLTRSAFVDTVPLVITFVSDLTSYETAQRLQAYNDRLAEFGSQPAQVLGVASATASSVRESADDIGIRFPILADPTGAFADACDARAGSREFDPVTLVTDAWGVIRHRIDDGDPSVAARALERVKEVRAPT